MQVKGETKIRIGVEKVDINVVSWCRVGTQMGIVNNNEIVVS
jgi:hypothetical protein